MSLEAWQPVILVPDLFLGRWQANKADHSAEDGMDPGHSCTQVLWCEGWCEAATVHSY